MNETSAAGGYTTWVDGHVRVAARADVADAVRAAMRGPSGARRTLYDFAATAPNARVLRGRGPAYAVALPQSDMRVVVRHNRHGGLFARLTGDLFVRPTGAPGELRTARELAALGIATPTVLAFAIYRAGPVARLAPLARADVVTEEIPDAMDLSDLLGHSTTDARRVALAATARLVATMSANGIFHPDLNAKNVLIRAVATGEAEAIVLDVDRVAFDIPGAPYVLGANLARLTGSLRKIRRAKGFLLSDEEIATLVRESSVVVPVTD